MIFRSSFDIWVLLECVVFTAPKRHNPPGFLFLCMLATSKSVLFPDHNHLQTTGADNPILWLSLKCQRVKGHQYQWLAGGYDLEIGHF